MMARRTKEATQAHRGMHTGWSVLGRDGRSGVESMDRYVRLKEKQRREDSDDRGEDSGRRRKTEKSGINSARDKAEKREGEHSR